MTRLLDLAPLVAFSQHETGARWVWFVAGLLFITLIVILLVEVFDQLRAGAERRRRIRRGEPDFSRPWLLGWGDTRLRDRHFRHIEAHPLTFHENRPQDPAEPREPGSGRRA